MVNSAVLMDLTLSDLEEVKIHIGYILAPILHKIGSTGKYSWITFIIGKGLP